MLSGLGGLAIISAAFNPDASVFRAPRWVAALGGAAVVLFGLTMQSFAGRKSSAKRRYTGYLPLALYLTCASLLAIWIAWGPGNREFKISLPIPVQWSSQTKEIAGRVAFSIAVPILGYLTFGTWRAYFRNRVEKGPRSEAKSRLPIQPGREQKE